MVALGLAAGPVVALGFTRFAYALLLPAMRADLDWSFATAGGITLHVTLVRGRNVHHIVEASFKGLARCLRDAVRVDGGGVPSTKGIL